MGLPSGYRQLTYIQSTGSQYINTNFVPTSNTQIDAEFQVASNIGNKNLFGGDTTAYVFDSMTDTSIEYSVGNSGWKTVEVSSITTKFSVSINKSRILFNDLLIASFSQSITSINPLYIFLRYGGTAYSSAKLYSFKIYESDVLVHDYKPCENSSGVVGLYDVISGQFYSSATSTALLGGAYTNIKTGDILNYAYTGAVQTVTLPKGIYKLECWGAQGGYRSGDIYGGCGGYSVGTLTLKANTQLFIYSGGSGNTGGVNGGFNGGGKRDSYNGGGGASDIRIGQDSLYARVIVAGGGGSCGGSSKAGGYGGGETGETANSGYGSGGGGGTQTAGGSGGSNNSGTFGTGGEGLYRRSGHGGAGGGGWYGGGGTYPDGSGDDDKGGGGGSGYVYTSTMATNYPTGCLLNSTYYLTEAQTIAGNASMPSTTGSTETGHSGDGYIRITVIKAQSLNIPVNIGNSWKSGDAISANIGGAWKQCESAYVNINGTWKELS